jgi:hypothetical protein
MDEQYCIAFAKFVLNKAKEYMGHDSETEIDWVLTELEDNPNDVISEFNKEQESA